MGFAELHLHLEGTVDRETAILLDPSLTRDEVDRVWGFTDFAGFLECFKFVARRLRGPADYALITGRMIESLSKQGVTYAEVTLGAGVVQWLGFNFDSVWRAIRTAQLEAQKQWPVEVWWNLDAIRQLGADHVMEIAKLTARYVDDGVVSFGVGGEERGGCDHGADSAFHVGCAAAVDFSIRYFAAIRVVRPREFIGNGHGVDVAV